MKEERQTVATEGGSPAERRQRGERAREGREYKKEEMSGIEQ